MGRCKDAAAEIDRKNSEQEEAERSFGGPIAVAELLNHESLPVGVPPHDDRDERPLPEGWNKLAQYFEPGDVLTDTDLSGLLYNAQTIIGAPEKALRITIRSRGCSGRAFEDVVAFATHRQIPARLKPTIDVLLTMTAAEAVSLANANSGIRGEAVIFDERRAERVLGISKRDWKQACHEGKVRTPDGVECSAHYVPAAAVVCSIDAGLLKPKYTVATALLVGEQRRRADLERKDREAAAAREPSLIERAADRAEHLAGDREREMQENQARLLKHYREILFRRQSPQPSDAEFLGQIMHELDITQADVERDLAALAEIERLESLPKELPRLEQAVVDLKRQIDELEAAWRNEHQLRGRWSNAWRMQTEARNAHAKVAEKKAEHRRLFDPV